MSNKRIRKKKAKRVIAQRRALFARMRLQYRYWYEVWPVDDLMQLFPKYNPEDYCFGSDVILESINTHSGEM